MNRREFHKTALGSVAASSQNSSHSHTANGQQVAPSIWKVTLGTPEQFTPVRLRRSQSATDGLRKLPAVSACPLSFDAISGRAMKRGYMASLPLEAGEVLYGFGLQLMSVIQRGVKRTLRVNADPHTDAGDSHAPVAFYVSTRGYGVLVDTARYAVFYTGNKLRKGQPHPAAAQPGAAAGQSGLPQVYFRNHFGEPSQVLVDVPSAAGVEIYIFGGPMMKQAVQRYNLFSGGGCLPSRWGLGVWYRTYGQFGQQEVVALAEDLRKSDIPCDVIGLEPGWQSHSYSCSFVWSDKFPDPKEMFAQLGARQYKVNNWEHAFTHSTSPIHRDLLPYSGEFEVWNGLVPDFTLPQARKTFQDFHDREHVALGLSGYKLDECDNSDYTGGWSFPEASVFPSGLDGEQYHVFFGREYQEVIHEIFVKRNIRTYGLVRSSTALAAPLPFVLYSDLYQHRDFLRGVVTAGFSGLLWTPEVRDATDAEDLIRRLQSLVLSPMALINAWYIRNPPWKQVKRQENNAGRFAADWQELERRCREILRLRMRLVPYLYSAFFKYHQEGVPPFRALVMDYPYDPHTWDIDDQWLVGEGLMAAPVTSGASKRDVYLPDGAWYDFWSGRRYDGRQTISFDVPLEIAPLFVKSGTILPLADPTLHTVDPASRNLTVQVYGDGDAPCMLYEDDGVTLDVLKGRFNRLHLTWDRQTGGGTFRREGTAEAPAYFVREWRHIA